MQRKFKRRREKICRAQPHVPSQSPGRVMDLWDAVVLQIVAHTALVLLSSQGLQHPLILVLQHLLLACRVGTGDGEELGGTDSSRSVHSYQHQSQSGSLIMALIRKLESLLTPDLLCR